jgi:ABC-type uncharacterized transport system auxiliary subunit
MKSFSSVTFAPLVGLLLTLPTSCALTNKADPLNLRYFAPHVPHASNSVGAPVGGGERVTVYIERVEGAAHLTEAIAYRKSETELAYHEGLRWTEQPSVYLERAMSEALFGDGTRTRGLSDRGYALDVSLEAFEQLSYGEPRVRIVTRVWVGDDRMGLSERRFVVDEPIGAPTDEPSALAQAFTRALTKTGLLVRRQVDEVAATATRVSSENLPGEGCVPARPPEGARPFGS